MKQSDLINYKLYIELIFQLNDRLIENNKEQQKIIQDQLNIMKSMVKEYEKQQSL